MPDKETTRRMRRVKSRGTNLEKNMQAILQSLGVQYELQPNLLGHPDFRIRGNRILIFCDSSFWHGRHKEDVSGMSFHKNRQFWSEKLAANKKRDRFITQKLTADGWTVLRFWDTEILRRTDFVSDKVRGVVNAGKR